MIDLHCLASPLVVVKYSKATLKERKNWFSDQLSLNAGQKYCRMPPLEHSVILSTFISYRLLLRSFFCKFMSGRFTQVLR